ncbi:hypothetical protein [Candidatus Binatus sp.]|uniref:hypothetical protein n=1 Tax=Candidatus Binatus sp. TaxID=2811406 RepID=UPI00272A5523|nr:hypothetical protein [Candidatus Binatus sp.]
MTFALLTRHLAYGAGHVKFMLAQKPERVDELTNYLLGGERFILDEYFGQQTWEALAILMGGGIARYDQGLEMVAGVKRKMVRDYVTRLESIGLGSYARPRCT